MPRRSPATEMSVQAAFRERMITEMDRRGLTDAVLAQKASKHHPMTANTIWKIRNAEPPRRIDIDEALAITQALDYDSIESLINFTGMAKLNEDLDNLTTDAMDMFNMIASATRRPAMLQETVARMGTEQIPPSKAASLAADLHQFLEALETGPMNRHIDSSITLLKGYRRDLRKLITAIEGLGWKE